MKNTRTNFFQHVKLHLLILVGYIVLFLGSWLTFMIGIFLLLPILIGIEYAVFSLYRDEQISIKDVFNFMDKSSRSVALSHYSLLSLIYGVLLALVPVIHNILLSIYFENAPDNILTALLVTFITILIYVIFQTFFSFSTIIKIDRNVSTQQAILKSKNLVFNKPFYFIGMRLIFFFRNIVLFILLGLQLMYRFGISDSPTNVSGRPAMIFLIGWFVLLVLSTPFYEKMMVKMYLKNKIELYN